LSTTTGVKAGSKHRTCRPLPVIIVTGVAEEIFTIHSEPKSGFRAASTGSVPSRHQPSAGLAVVAAEVGFVACATGFVSCTAGFCCACANAQAIKNKNSFFTIVNLLFNIIS
jgi:hypothetical protein